MEANPHDEPPLPEGLPLLQLFDPVSSTFTYVLWDAATRDAVVIDPVREQVGRDLAALDERGLALRWTIETHAHADHVTGSGQLAAQRGAGTAAPLQCGIAPALRQLEHGDEITFGGQALVALHTPGHTAGSTCYLWRGMGCVFTGDTLLIGGCGRTDFQSGDAGALWDSVTRELWSLPDDTLVFPGHDYRGRRRSTIGAEKAANARFTGRTRAEFIALMGKLDLPRPRLIDIAVPANLRLGIEEGQAPQGA